MELDFSFCIVTDNSTEACKRISEIVKSIRALEIPNYEIIAIGGDKNRFSGNLDDFRKINFDESITSGWITKKKNDVAKLCKYDNLVMLHDYFVFHKNWYKGYKKIYDDFVSCDVCSNPVFMIDGRREFTDWVTLDYPDHGLHYSLNYNDWNQTKYQYISGGYFIVKKQFMLDNPFSESLTAHQAEDVEWSKRIRSKAKIICNPYSYVKHNKEHRNLEIPPDEIWKRLI